MKEILRVQTKNEAETQKFARLLAEEILALSKISKSKGAIVLGIEGELGAGKTTFAKGFARGLNIKEEMKSPTFILMRVFRLSPSKKYRSPTSVFLHLDAYRTDNPKEFIALGFKKLLSDPKNILLVEWSDKIKKLMPKKYFRLVLRSPTSKKSRSRTSREISLSY